MTKRNLIISQSREVIENINQNCLKSLIQYVSEKKLVNPGQIVRLIFQWNLAKNFKT